MARYLNGTTDYGLMLYKSATFDLTSYVDADSATCLDYRRSTTGFCAYIGNSLVSWTSKKKNVMSPTSIEAELCALIHIVIEVMWIKKLYAELQIELGNPPLIFCDNINTRRPAKHPILHFPTKPVEIAFQFMRDNVIDGSLQVEYTPSQEHVVGIFTKSL